MKGSSRFRYCADAVAFAGRFQRPREVVMPAQSTVSLPIIGGFANGGVVEDYTSPNGIVSFTSASSRTSGTFLPDERVFETTVSVGVFGAQIVGHDPGTGITQDVAFGEISTKLVSKHRGKKGKATAVTVPKRIVEGLAVNGHRLKVRFADGLLVLATLKKLKKAFEDDNDRWFKKHGHLFERLEGGKRRLPLKNGMVLCTIVDRIEWEDAADPAPGTVIDGNRITIENFGALRLGEMMISEHERRLEMLRIDLGSPVEGIVTFSGSGTDGHGWPP